MRRFRLLLLLWIPAAAVLSVAVAFQPPRWLRWFVPASWQVEAALPFDSARWKSDRIPLWSVEHRTRMLASLLEGGKLSGLSRVEVVNLLGEPYGTHGPTPFGEGAEPPRSLVRTWMTYRVGERGGYEVELCLGLDERQTVVDVAVIH